MKIQYKLLYEGAVAPTKAHTTDAGYDLTAWSASTSNVSDYIEYNTGVAVNIPEGYVGLLFPRSSVTNKDMMLKNSVGVLDSGFQGAILFRYWEYGDEIYKVGDRVGQLVILKLPEVELEETDSFTKSERGENGFGSTGN
jgi:dUTP pyrophosphatase